LLCFLYQDELDKLKTTERPKTEEEKAEEKKKEEEQQKELSDIEIKDGDYQVRLSILYLRYICAFAPFMRIA
jgi:hypothetical protein